MEDQKFLFLLNTVATHWHQSAKVYKDYMENGKKFRYAAILRYHNTAVYTLLEENKEWVPAEYIEDVEAIVGHYNTWTSKWDALHARLQPGPDDVFVFENEHRFPRAAANKLEGLLNADRL